LNSRATEQQAEMLFLNMGMAEAVQADVEGFSVFGNKYTLNSYERTHERESEIVMLLEGGHYLNMHNTLRDKYLSNGANLYADRKHYSELGHELVAKTLYEYIIKYIYANKTK
jgi:hypothetical protein